MATNKVVFGDETLIDISQDTVTAETLAKGVTAHDKHGDPIVGTMTSGGGSGSGIIEVTELPTENIDENTVYKVVNDGRIVYVLYPDGSYVTLADFLSTMGMQEVHTYFVDELPSDMLESNTETGVIHGYVVNSTGIAYGYIADMGVLPCSAILGIPDKGYTDDISLETEVGVYVQRGEASADWFIRENGEWVRISPDTQTKEVTFTENGDYEIIPDSGKLLSKATVKVDVPIPETVLIDSGTCGDNITWKLYDNGILYLSGTGHCYDYNVSSSPLCGKKTFKRVIVEEGVASLGAYIFYNCDVEEVFLADSVIALFDRTFGGNKNLRSISFGSGLVTRYATAFEGCTAIEDVFYKGTKAQWDSLRIINGTTTGLENATLHCEYEDNSSKYNEGYEAGKLDGYSEGYTASQNSRQEKVVTQNGEVTADEGYSGLSKVIVDVKNTDTVDGWHVDVRSDGSDPPIGTTNTITFVYGG